MIRNAIAVGALVLALAGCEGVFDNPKSAGNGPPADAAVMEPPPGPATMTMVDLEPSTPPPPTPLPKRKPPLRHDEVIELQSALQRFGYDPGPIDGFLGPRTLAAVRAYQTATGLPIGGGITYALLQRLRSQVRTAETAQDAKGGMQAAPAVDPAAGGTDQQKARPPQGQPDQTRQQKGIFSRIFGPLFGK